MKLASSLEVLSAERAEKANYKLKQTLWLLIGYNTKRHTLFKEQVPAFHSAQQHFELIVQNKFICSQNLIEGNTHHKPALCHPCSTHYRPSLNDSGHRICYSKAAQSGISRRRTFLCLYSIVCPSPDFAPSQYAKQSKQSALIGQVM